MGFHAISPNKQYLITITQYQPKFDDFKHKKDKKNYIRRENEQYSYSTKPQFKYSHFDECHKTYYDGTENMKENKKNNMNLMMDTERGCNIYLWSLDKNDYI